MKPFLGVHPAPAALLLMAIVSGLLPTAAMAPPASATQAPAEVAEADIGPAIRKALEGDWEAHYFAAAVDLNGDGKKEVVAYVAGPMVCGTGGCTTFVFTPGPGGYRLVARISVVQTPILVSSRRMQGWRNLVVRIAGGGIESGYSELKFDGKSYPMNPTVLPAKRVSDIAGAEVLIPEFQSYKDGTEVPAGHVK